MHPILKVAGLGALAFSLSGCKVSDILTGYVANTMCTKVFVSGLPEEHIIETDLEPNTLGLLAITKINVDYAKKTVVASADQFRSKSVYRENQGCTLVGEVSESELRDQVVPSVPPVNLPADEYWPQGKKGVSVVEGVDLDLIESLAAPLFTEHLDYGQNTSSVLVAYRGQLIYERYAPLYSPDTKVALFSVSKTIAAAIAGIAHEDGIIDVYEPINAPEWAWSIDPRRKINSYQLLSMTAGLGSPLTSNQIDPDTFVLQKEDDMAHAFAKKLLFASPGTQWHYNTGNFLLFDRMIQEMLGGKNAYYEYLQEELFHKINVNSAVVQADNAGTMTLGMFTFMTPRDLARFGQLLENGGTWEGKEVVPSYWLDTMLQAVPFPTTWNVDYGVGVLPNTEVTGKKFWPELPSDAMTLAGYRGQFMVVVPSLDLVMLRTGDSLNEDEYPKELAKFFHQVPAALPN